MQLLDDIFTLKDDRIDWRLLLNRVDLNLNMCMQCHTLHQQEVQSCYFLFQHCKECDWSDRCPNSKRFRNSSAWHARSEQSLAFFLPQQSCILYLSVLEENIGLTGWKSHTATFTHGHTHADRLKDWLRKHLWWFQDLWDFPALRCSKTGPPERITQPENWKEKTKTEKTAPVSTASCQHWRPDVWKTQ